MMFTIHRVFHRVPALMGTLSMVAALFVGCSSETGILAVVSGSSVHEIEFQVGIQRGDRWEIDQEVSGKRADVRDRNLRSDPYGLLLREPDETANPLTIRLLAVGIRREEEQDRRVSTGVMDPPQPFVRGEVLRRNVGLRPLGDGASVRESNGCFDVRIGEDRWSWVSADNVDCDPVAEGDDPPDCAPEDGTVYPGSSELCDGKDNSCDGKLGPEQGLCYARTDGETGVCREGTRFCETEGKGSGPCQPGDQVVPEGFCKVFPSCAGLASPRSCVRSRAGLRVATCAVQVQAGDGKNCPQSFVTLEPFTEAEKCRWVVVDGGGFIVGFGEELKPSTGACNAQLTLQIDQASSRRDLVVVEFFANDEPAGFIEAEVAPQSVAVCEGDTVTCSENG